MTGSRIRCCFLIAIFVLAAAATAAGQTTSFTYQGRLTDGGTPANGNYDFIFQLYDASDGDNLLGHEVGAPSTPVTDGIFSVTLDFGANAFPGADRFLQIIVRRTGDQGIPTLLSPRQKLTSTPYAIRSLTATTADTATNATQLGGTAASQFVLTADARLSDARPPVAGSGNYIQNGTVAQPSSDFNITGTGRANTFDANQFDLGGARALSNAGTSNLFAGQGAGQANNLGNRNAFFGYNAGLSNTIGELNSFFGNVAGQNNKEGRSNDFFGDSAGIFNLSGSNNSIFGSQAGTQNSTGSFNTFIGNYAGQTNTTGNNNTAIGYLSNVLSNNLTNATAIGANSRVDSSNSLVLGSINGVNGATADTNVGIGITTPHARLHVLGNGVIEGDLNVTGTINGNFNGTIQTANNALNLGGIAASQFVQTADARLFDARPPTAGSANYVQNGTTQQPATNFNVSGTGQADSFDAATQFKLGGVRVLSNAGTRNLFAGAGAGQANTTGASNAFFGNNAGPVNDAGTSNSFFGSNAGFVNTSGNFNAFFGAGSGSANVDGNNNAFFGFTSGRTNASGFNNSFFGNAAGFGNTNGGNNSYFGFFAGKNNSLGQQNTFVGASTGATNVTGGNNTLLGYGADVGAPDNSNATAIGAQAFVTQADSLVLGAINGVNGANFDTKVGIGTTAPAAKLHVVGDGLFTGNLTVNGNLNGNFSLNTVNAVTQYNLAGSRILSGDTTSNNFFAGFGTGGSITSGTRNAFFGSLAGVLTTSGSQNAFFGYQAGNQNSTGAANSFFGAQAGQKNTSGNGNSFFGGNAGLNNSTGGDNSYFGVNAGNANTGGSFNSMFGESAGQNNTTVFNSFFGYQAGQMTSTGDTNAFFGFQAGQSNTGGSRNAFFGAGSGSFTTGSRNAFIGTSAGGHNLTGNGNIAIGDTADFGASGLQNATAIGNRALVSASDSLILGGILGVNGCTAANNCNDTKVGIGTPAPTTKLHVVGDGLFTGNLTVNGTLNANIAPGNANYIQNTSTQQATSNFNISGNGTAGGTLSGNVVSAVTQYNIGGSRVLRSDTNANVLLGFDAGGVDPIPNPGTQNTFIGLQAGSLNQGNRNVFVGFQAGQVNSTGTSNTALGRRADFGANNLDHATAIGAETVVSTSNTIALGRSGGQDTVQIPGNLTVNGTFNATLPTGSANYIQNTIAQQANSNFNIAGNGILGGRVGIGTTAPITRLHVVADGFEGLVQGLRVETNFPGGIVASFGSKGMFAIDDATPGYAGGRFTVRENGNVGIGFNDPQTKLDIGDPSNTGLRVRTFAAGGTVASFGGNGAFQIDAANAPGGRFTVLENGNVGINTNGPTAKLEVNGNIKTSGTISAGGPISGDGSGLTNVSAATAITAQSISKLSLVGMLRWDLLAIRSFDVDNGPAAVAFDGANTWVVNSMASTVTKLRASDGVNLGTFEVIGGQGIAFDGANIWVTSSSSIDNDHNNVTLLRASDGANLGTFSVGTCCRPRGIAFDGANMWVATAFGDVKKYRASDLALQGTFSTAFLSYGVAFDGANTWVTNNGTNNVTKLRASDGANLGTFGVGNGPLGIAFDGANVWVVNSGDNNVTKLRASDGANLGTFGVGTGPNSIAFDGESMWVTNGASNSVTKLRASDGANLGTFLFGIQPAGVAFDGAYVWLTNSAGNNVVRVPSFFHAP